MSNVLIGIIGVILFIGLALAGALFLGPRFQQSTNSSKGSAAVQAVSQIASSANMANVQGGTPVASTGVVGAATTDGLVTNGYLKTVPSNPVTSANVPQLTLTDGTNTGTTTATSVVMDLGATASGVCSAIAQQSGQAATDVTTGLGAVPSSPSGCFYYTGTTKGGLTNKDYVAFATI